MRLRTRVAAAVVLAGLSLCGTAGIAQAQETSIRVAGDATTCQQASQGAGVDIAGDVLLAVDGARSGANKNVLGVVPNGTSLNVTLLNGQIEITAVVIEGAGAYNVYPTGGLGVLKGLRAPTIGPGQFPTIGHWFVCGGPVGSTPSPQPVPTKVPAGLAGDRSQHNGIVTAGLALLGLLATGSAVLAWRHRPHGV